MNRMRGWALAAGVGLVAALGCYRTERPAPAQLSPPPPAGTPLPQGWAWPFAPHDGQRALASWSVLRPFDVAAVARRQRTGPGAPVQVAPNVWITPLRAPLPRLSASPAVPPRMALMEGGAQTLPDQVDLRAVGYDGPVKSQQMVGVCWTFALSTLMDNALRRAARQEVMAPLHILSADLWDELFRDGRSQTDLVTEPSWPYDPPKACKLNESKSEVWCDEAYHVRHGSWREDPALVQEVERAKQQGVFRIAKLEKIANPSDTRQIAAAIASGQAVYLGMNINTDVWANPNQGQLANWTAADGAHAVAAVGYRTSGGQRQFLLHNSWGTTWADGGYAWVSEAMVATKTDEAFTLEVSGPHGQPLPTTTKLPSPQQQKPAGGGFPIPLPWPFPQPGPAQPQPQPSGGVGCGAGLVRDLVFGVCVSPCASGGPPTAGICPFGAGPSGKGGQQPSPAGCAAGAVKDLVTGQCASQCPNGMPPAAGACVPWRP